MVERGTNQLDLVFHALAHPARREMMRRLSAEERTIGELADIFDVSLEATSKHVRILERAKLVTRKRDGRVNRLTMRREPLRRAAKLIAQLSQFWEQRLDSMETLLKEME